MTMKMKSWLKKEDDVLRRYYPVQGRLITQAILRAIGFKRSRRAVTCRAHKLNLKMRWTGKETWILRQTYAEFGARYSQRYMTHRSLVAIRDKARREGIDAGHANSHQQKARILAMEGHDHLKALAWLGVKYRGE